MVPVLVGVPAVYLAACGRMAWSYLHPPSLTDEMPEGVRETTVGTAPAWATAGLAQGKPSRIVFVLAHGYGGRRTTWNGLLADLQRAGIDAVVPTMPGHNDHPDSTVGFGRKEAQTVLECAAWVRAQGAERVVGLGVSLGGAAVWLASAEDPQALDGVVTDAAFATFTEAMNRMFSYRLPVPGGATLLRPVVWFARAMSGIDPDAIRPLDAAKAWHGRPALVIQGDQDPLILPSHGERLAAAAGCPLWLVRGAGHAEDYPTDPEGYARRVVAFAEGLP